MWHASPPASTDPSQQACMKCLSYPYPCPSCPCPPPTSQWGPRAPPQPAPRRRCWPPASSGTTATTSSAFHTTASSATPAASTCRCASRASARLLASAQAANPAAAATASTERDEGRCGRCARVIEIVETPRCIRAYAPLSSTSPPEHADAIQPSRRVCYGHNTADHPRLHDEHPRAPVRRRSTQPRPHTRTRGWSWLS